MTSAPMIDYEALAQNAMRGVVRTILARVAKSGLPGDHHFYVSFSTTAEGVSVSKRLKEKYPEEMTIVLQHRFWDLAVTDERFEVKLTFDGIPERLVVPFSAVKVFFDPSVRYGLQFEAPDFGPDATAHPHAGGNEDTIGEGGSPSMIQTGASTRPMRATPERKHRPPRKSRSDKADETPAAPAIADKPEKSERTDRPAPKPLAAVAKPEQAQPASGKSAQPSQPAASASGAQIVSLDSFRKK